MMLKNIKIAILLIALFVGAFIIFTKGIKLGLDFKGGTQFQIKLQKEVSGKEMRSIVSIIQKRLDWSGLKDTKVYPVGKQLVFAQIAETNPDEIEKIENILKKQGKFEVVLDGNVVFTGKDIVEIIKDPTRGFGVRRLENGYRWTLPFMLKSSAALRFAKMSYKKCKPVGVYEGKVKYECEKTFFFIDRPVGGVVVLSEELYNALSTDDYLLVYNLNLEEVAKEAGVSIIKYKTKEDINADVIKNAAVVIVPEDIDENILSFLKSINKNVKKIPYKKGNWFFDAVGLKTIVSLSEDVTNMKASCPDVGCANFKVYQNLVITGVTKTKEEALNRLNEILVILESGSLPVPIESISKEIISPTLGEKFLRIALLIGIASIIMVAFVLYIRYKYGKIIVPIIFTGLCEVFLILAFASLVGWNLDLASMAGIIAAVGTGVDDQIIIMDELSKKEEEKHSGILKKIKNAFFIIFAAAATTIATMLPIIMFGSGLSKLVGFALTTTAGILIGVFITRPAFSEIAKNIIQKSKKVEEQKTNKGR